MTAADRDMRLLRLARERRLLTEQEAEKCRKVCQETGRSLVEVVRSLDLIEQSDLDLMLELMEELPASYATTAKAGGAKPAPLADDPTVVRSPPAFVEKRVDSARDAGASAEAVPSRIGRYEIQRELGRGGMGVVYLARDPELGREVALKVLRFTTDASGHDRQRFLQEARAAARLRHPGIVSVFEIGESESNLYLAMEYVQGEPLQALIRRMGVIPPRAALKLAAQVADALEYAQQHGIIHRDIKPGNILVTIDSDESGKSHRKRDSTLHFSSGASSSFRALLLDFGLARDVESDTRITITGQLMGTPAYMSPEQADGDTNRINVTSDVYSLGAVLYEMLTGRLPFRAESLLQLLPKIIAEEPAAPRALVPAIHPDVQTITLKAMAKEQARRYATPGELAADLKRYLRGEAILARPHSRAYRAWRFLMRHRAASLTTLAVLVFLLGWGLYAWTRPAFLRLRVRPLGARVTVADRTVVVDSPEKLVELPPGTYLILAELKDHETVLREEKNIARNETRDFNVTLLHDTGRVELETHPVEEIRIEGDLAGDPVRNLRTNRIELTLPTGPHTLWLSRKNYFRVPLPLEVRKDQVERRRVTLPRAVDWEVSRLAWSNETSPGDVTGDGIPDIAARSFKNLVVISGGTGEIWFEGNPGTRVNCFCTVGMSIATELRNW